MAQKNQSNPFDQVVRYSRVSSPEQVLGMGLDRQADDLKRLIEQHGLQDVKPHDISDEGKSGFHGHHRTAGDFGIFEAEVEAGEWPNTLFVCENLDRFTRQGIDEGLALIRKFTTNGVTLWTADGDVFPAGQPLDIISGIQAIVKFDLAHKESVKKVERSQANVRIRREFCRITKEAFSKVCPGWLDIDPTTRRYVAVPAYAAIVQQIFDMADRQNMGALTIAKALNAQGVKPFTSRYRKKRPLGWEHRTIGMILSSRAVLGEYQPLTKGEPDGEVWLDYYPTIISHDQFNRVQRSGPAKKAAGGKKVNNLFAPLVRCSCCGAAMLYQATSGGRPGYLACPNNRRGVCANNSHWHYRNLENGILDEVLHLVMDARAFSNRGELARLNTTIAERERQLEVSQARAKRLWDAYGQTGSDGAMQAALVCDAEVSELSANIEALRNQRDDASGRVDSAEHLKRVADIRAALYHPDEEERRLVRMKVSLHFRQILESVVLDDRRARVTFKGRSGYLDFDRQGQRIGPAKEYQVATVFENLEAAGDVVKRQSAAA
jgi:hypothetical protein